MSLKVLSAAHVERHSKSEIENYHDISFSVPNMVLKIVKVQTVFRIASAVAIPKTICIIE